MNAVAVFIKLLSGLFLNKILAIYLGPGGYSIIGQFQNVVSIAGSVAGGIFTTGVIKSTADHFDSNRKQHEIWKTAIRISLFFSVVCGLGLIVFGDWLSYRVLNRTDISGVFIWLAISLPAMTVSNLLLAIINGKKEVGIYVISNVITSIQGLILTGLLASYFGLYGALVAFVINPTLSILSVAFLVYKKHWFSLNYFWGQINRDALKELTGLGLMGLTTALVVPISFIAIRNYLSENISLNAAGYWQAIWKISETYLTIITTTLIVYYLPRIAEIRCGSELKKEIIKIYIFAMPITVAGAVLIYILKDHIILALFTPEFMPMQKLFAWQLMGDVIKIAAWIMSYVLIGRALVRIYIFTEIIFSALFILLTIYLVPIFGLIGVTIAYAMNYFLYGFCMIFILSRELKIMGNKSN
ncbi:O-antigen translocase [Polynucleobacter sp. MWH-Adler-W8]|uniref:O-antigen translocase n=1 Tax=Polynucleobacter sp. MWH-Adler-W8 TaxID=1819727 RepID=UPI0013013B97|nr:O-antigen translocase [Polynucleobacter sp. MWH-Adler-W8]